MRYGSPTRRMRMRLPADELQLGELADWFQDWHVIHYFEGLLESPRRAVAQVVCRRPGE